MATGERTWNSEGKQAKRTEFKALPAGKYSFRLDASKCKVHAKPGKVPSVQAVLNISYEGAEKPRTLYVFLSPSLREGKDGVANAERANQILGLARGLGVETPDFSIVTISAPRYNKDGSIDKMEPTDILNTKQILRWLQANDGAEGEVQLRVRKYNGQENNEVEYFVEKEADDTFGSDSTDDTEEEEVEDAVPSLDDEDEEEEAPAPVKTKKGKR